MNLDLSEDQRLLKEMVERFVADRYDFEARTHILASADGWSRDIWRAMAELGLLAIPFAEEDGGLGGGPVETMIVMEALGGGLVVEPYLATVVLAGGLLAMAGTAAQKAARLPGLIAGERVMTLAHLEPGGPRQGFDRIATTARREGEGWRLDGAKVAVPYGADADEIVVSAKVEGEGPGLFLVPGDAAGLERKRQRGYDGVPIAALRLDAVRLPGEALLGEAGAGADLLARRAEAAIAALAAEAVGAMAAALDLTTDYLKTREQFGMKIGSFQALQHRAVDMLIALELSRSMAILAAVSLDAPPAERAAAIAAAKVQVGRAGRFIGQQAVQLHGAIGITEEYKVGHAFKRLTAIDALFGDADHHLDAIAQAGGLG